jgi:hypothetical protein
MSLLPSSAPSSTDATSSSVLLVGPNAKPPFSKESDGQTSETRAEPTLVVKHNLDSDIDSSEHVLSRLKESLSIGDPQPKTGEGYFQTGEKLEQPRTANVQTVSGSGPAREAEPAIKLDHGPFLFASNVDEDLSGYDDEGRSDICELSSPVSDNHDTQSLASFNFPFASSSTLDLVGWRQGFRALASQTPSDDGGASDDDSDPDSNPLYLLLSNGSSPHLRQAWENARVILVPPRRTLPLEVEEADPQALRKGEEPSGWERFVGMHVLCPSAVVTDGFVGYGELRGGARIEARLDVAKGQVIVETRNQKSSSSGQANVKKGAGKDADSPSGLETQPPSLESSLRRPEPLNRSVSASSTVSTIPFPKTPSSLPTAASPIPPQIELSRTLKILSETTVYRRATPPVPQSPVRTQPALSKLTPSPKSKGRKDKVRFKGLKWLRPSGSKEKEKEKEREREKARLKEKAGEQSQQPDYERLRVLSVDGAVIDWFGSELSLHVEELVVEEEEEEEEDEATSPALAAEDGDETEAEQHTVSSSPSVPKATGLARSLSSMSSMSKPSRGRAFSSLELVRARSGFPFASVVPQSRDVVGQVLSTLSC